MKKSSIRRNLFSLVLIVFGIQAVAQQQPQPQLHRFSVKESIDYATKNSAQVKNALLNYKVQEQVNRSITSEALPQVSGSIAFTDNLILPTSLVPGEFAGQAPGTFIPIKFGTQYNTAIGVTLKQVLFDGEVFVGLQARSTALAYAQKSTEITEQNIRVNIYKVYYQLVLSKAQMELIDDNIARAEELLHNTTEMFKNGFSEKLDVDKASVQLANLLTEKVQTNFTIETGYLGLKVLLGMPIRDSLVLTDSLTYEMVSNASLNENDYQYTDRRDFQLLGLNRDLNEFDLKRYRKLYLPSVSVNAGLNTNAYRTKFDIFGPGMWFPASYLGLSISVPIFDGLYKDANIQKAKLTLRQTENQMDALKISIDDEVKEAQLRFAAAMATLNFQKKNMDLAESVYNQTRKKYEQGVGSNTEITSAESDLKQAQTNYIQALYNTVIAKIDYQNAIGKI
ncbi:MAG TPA: TolC family protein [Puia sp.]|nr:TolC family protein [Puia sp.]